MYLLPFLKFPTHYYAIPFLPSHLMHLLPTTTITTTHTYTPGGGGGRRGRGRGGGGSLGMVAVCGIFSPPTWGNGGGNEVMPGD